MPSDQPGPSRPRRVRIPGSSLARRTRSVSQQSASPRLSARDFIVSSSSSSSSSSNASISPTLSSRSSATSRTGSPTTAASQEPSSAVVKVDKATYWPIVREYINNGGHEAGLGRIQVECLICHEELPVRGIEPSEELLQHKEPVVMGCGHIFCRPCLAEWWCNYKPTCPLCQKRTECQGCKAQARWVAIPKDNDDLNEVPPTESERPGKELPSLCVRCEARRCWIFDVDRGRHGLPSRGVIDSDFQRLMYHMMDRLEDRKMAMGMDEMERELLVLFNEHFMRLLDARERYISRYAHDPLNARIHGFG
ncbi:hypothetical protein CFAM422_002463 [Trichoderma lentiforme]|uniref:RING-type domain-containing protein n=1 Tax=Trichoderma lentiforme TaxID=1567552 RepID=A0A9P4XL88_9HYPO|nr:hypothetical protein CFAM422_002463 [Trichoderma lentiforme]